VLTSSTDDDSSPNRKAAGDLRDSWIFRLVALVVVLLVAFGVARSCGSTGRNVTADEAVVIARESTDFKPDKHQVRFFQQGIPPQPRWAVSLYDVGPLGRPIRVYLVIVDARTGAVLEQGR
jgi:hypothetical protein